MTKEIRELEEKNYQRKLLLVTATERLYDFNRCRKPII